MEELLLAALGDYDRQTDRPTKRLTDPGHREVTLPLIK